MSGRTKRPKGQIDRRDFLNGVAVAIGASLCPVHGAFAAGSGPDPSPLDPLLARGITQDDPRYNPPALEGMRGSHPGSFETAHQVRDDKRWHETGDVIDTGEAYDLVVVGGGISGLSAAYFFRKQNPNARVLILDNHDDFGGHAKRNEFQADDRMLLGYGGTQSIEAPADYSPVAKALLKDLGIVPQRFYKDYDRSYYKSFHAGPAIFFDRETFGVDRLVTGTQAWKQIRLPAFWTISSPFSAPNASRKCRSPRRPVPISRGCATSPSIIWPISRPSGGAPR